MPEYRRLFLPGGTYFFTLVTNFRRPILTAESARAALRTAMHSVRARHPFNVDAIVLLPDHLHCLWTLPPGDEDYSTRWRLIKSAFTMNYLAAGETETARSDSRKKQNERGVWQRRFWEHTVRDETEFERLCDYIHYNPVKHAHATCPHAWPYSTFDRFVCDRRYDVDWCCSCAHTARTPHFADLDEITGE